MTKYSIFQYLKNIIYVYLLFYCHKVVGSGSHPKSTKTKSKSEKYKNMMNLFGVLHNISLIYCCAAYITCCTRVIKYSISSTHFVDYFPTFIYNYNYQYY